MTISVVRRLGVEAMPFRVSRMRGIASPTTGTTGAPKSSVSGLGTGSTVGMVTRGASSTMVGAIVATVALTATVSRSDMGTGVEVGVATGMGTGVGGGA